MLFWSHVSIKKFKLQHVESVFIKIWVVQWLSAEMLGSSLRYALSCFDFLTFFNSQLPNSVRITLASHFSYDTAYPNNAKFFFALSQILMNKFAIQFFFSPSSYNGKKIFWNLFGTSCTSPEAAAAGDKSFSFYFSSERRAQFCLKCFS